jgi:hypothetical protein
MQTGTTMTMAATTNQLGAAFQAGPRRTPTKASLIQSNKPLTALSHSDCVSIFGKPGIFGGSATAAQVLDSLIQSNSQYGSIQVVNPDYATPAQQFLFLQATLVL